VKVAGRGEHRVEALRLAQAFGARTLDATLNSFIFEFTGAIDEVDRFIRVMAETGVVDVARTGVAALPRGSSKG